MIEVRIPSLSSFAMEIFSPGDLLDERDAPTELLLLQSRDKAGSGEDTEDIVTLKIPHHFIALPRSDMTPFHHQLEIHLLARSLFLRPL
jgi:hypothetical protein